MIGCLFSSKAIVSKQSDIAFVGPKRHPLSKVVEQYDSEVCPLNLLLDPLHRDFPSLSSLL